MLIHNTANLKLSKYLIAQQDNDFVYLFSTRSAELLKLTESKWHALHNGTLGQINSTDLKLLTELQILVPQDEDELNTLLQAIPETESISDLNFVILPSSNCPLGCNLPEYGAYCGQTHQSGLLAPEHQDAFVENLRSLVRPQHKKLIISWFGAEPLTGMDVIERMSKKLIQLASELGLKYSANVVTGGTLLSLPVARALKECQVHSISLTIDGPKEVHDTRRCTKAGTPTFDKITDNINAIIQTPDLLEMQISVRTNVDARNQHSIMDFIKFAAKHNWQERVEINFAPVHPWGQLEDNDFALSKDDYAEWEITALRKLMDCGFSPQLLPTKRPLVCRVVSPFSGVLGHNGIMHKCSESPLTSLNPMNDDLGTVSVEQSQWDKTWNWKGVVESGSVPCNECVMLPVCGGGCPLAWQTGAHEPCPSAKRNIVQRISLFAEQEHLPRTRGLKITPHRIVGFLKKFANINPDLIREYENILTSALIKATTGNFESAEQKVSEARALKLKFGLQLWVQLVSEAALAMVRAYLFYRQNMLDKAEECLSQVHANLRRAHNQNPSLPVFASQFQAAINLLRIRQISQIAPYDLAQRMLNTLQKGDRLVFEGVCLVDSVSHVDAPSETVDEWLYEIRACLDGNQKSCPNLYEIITGPVK